jgi:hypothetical protein
MSDTIDGIESLIDQNLRLFTPCFLDQQFWLERVLSFDKSSVISLFLRDFFSNCLNLSSSHKQNGARNLPTFSSVSKPMSQSWGRWALETIGIETLSRDSDLKISSPCMPQNNHSMVFITKGVKEKSLRIGGINGINGSLESAVKHAEYISQLAQDRSIEWVYNHTNSVFVDTLEVATMNMIGFSPNTAKLLQENWSEFHFENRDHANAKYLQICHSQGAIHVKNALQQVSEEIRHRVIVLAIAPATIVSNDLCYESYNYASTSDVIPNLEVLLADFIGPMGEERSDFQENVNLLQNQLIKLNPHPDANWIDHDFQSLTFKPQIKAHLEDYINCKGQYI